MIVFSIFKKEKGNMETLKRWKYRSVNYDVGYRYIRKTPFSSVTRSRDNNRYIKWRPVWKQKM